jgi:hypothetical protein
MAAVKKQIERNDLRTTAATRSERVHQEYIDTAGKEKVQLYEERESESEKREKSDHNNCNSKRYNNSMHTDHGHGLDCVSSLLVFREQYGIPCTRKHRFKTITCRSLEYLVQ